MSQYHWIVTRDEVLGDSSDAIGQIGPKGAPKPRPRFDEIIIGGSHFRLLTASGETQFTGYILGEFTGLEPLVDYGVDNGCKRIQYQRDGQWIEHDASSLFQPDGS